VKQKNGLAIEPTRICYLILVAQVHSNWNIVLAELSKWMELYSEENLLPRTTGK